MLKAVVYVSVATAFLLLIVFFPNNHRIHGHLGRRLGYKPHLNFDPLIAKMERLKEERASGKGSLPVLSENETVAKEIGDGHNYFSGAGRLNITLRLCILFPLVDDAPRDGFIEFKELEAWNTEQALDRLNYRTERELALMDKDGDGAITFREYLPQLDDAAMAKNGMEHGEAGWWKEQFNNADADRDGSLSFNEFRDLLHPEDSNNEEIHKWLLKEKIKRMDHHENDGKLNFMEFRERVYDNYKIYVEFESAGDHVPTAEEKFAELDVDKDKLLTVEELKPIFHYLYPGELSYARYYTSYLIYEADDDGDGKLTLNEILNHDYIFYSTVYVDGRDHDVHDEL